MKDIFKTLLKIADLTDGEELNICCSTKLHNVGIVANEFDDAGYRCVLKQTDINSGVCDVCAASPINAPCAIKMLACFCLRGYYCTVSFADQDFFEGREQKRLEKLNNELIEIC